MNPQARRWTVGLLSAALIAATGAVAGPAGAAPAAPVSLLVGLKPGYDATARLDTLARLGLQAAEARGQARTGRLAAIGAKAFEVPANRVELTLAALRRDPAVAYASVDPKAQAVDVAPNDPLFTSRNQPELGQIKVPAAWGTTTGSGSVVVAVVDTGVTEIGDLSGQVMDGIDLAGGDNFPKDEGRFPHGTVVASLIAGRGNDGRGMAGVCWQCQILPVRVLDREGNGSYSTIADGIIWAAQNGADIINLSLGGVTNGKVLADAVAYANGRGALVVAAAGNSNSSKRFYPAAYPGVLSVGGSATYGADYNAKASFSNYGPDWVDVAAPGLTAGMSSNGGYYYGKTNAAQGTSFAAPLVSGVAALVKSAHPNYTGWSLQNAVISSAVKPTSVRPWTRYGLVNAAKALTVGTDTRPPAAKYISPGQNARVHGNVAIKPVGVTDNWSGVQKVDLYVNGKWANWSYTSPFAPTLKTGSRNGPIRVKLRITDRAGNATWTGERTLIADNVKPKVSLGSAKKNKAKVKGTVTVTAKASDASGISKVQLLVNGKVVATDTTAGYTLKFKVKSQKKTMKIKLRAYDRAGNYTTTGVLRTYYRA
ncbi:S8 family serine peptidase [Actinoplanes teichomyceticus]|uniref:Subtilisin family serine protease n=1 Tax=Actinoplanes teichomyceticus TaxID=1867 RepID=A0A561VQD1_ACTTI|nr:S8 family serine peptidase [Actinoplanes teichomyceticus]TWG13819.1 subtilisin family serine protease [Actinoplanes teichomyceticus]GIF12354.1 hypothetical protein Ate01nite_23860 [Actinoplanes teichomyceticus]